MERKECGSIPIFSKVIITLITIIAQQRTYNRRVYAAHFVEREIIEFAPSRLPQKKLFYHSGKRDGVNTTTLVVMPDYKRRLCYTKVKVITEVTIIGYYSYHQRKNKKARI